MQRSQTQPETKSVLHIDQTMSIYTVCIIVAEYHIFMFCFSCVNAIHHYCNLKPKALKVYISPRTSGHISQVLEYSSQTIY